MLDGVEDLASVAERVGEEDFDAEDFDLRGAGADVSTRPRQSNQG